jgi:hypothetical protein
MYHEGVCAYQWPIFLDSFCDFPRSQNYMLSDRYLMSIA